VTVLAKHPDEEKIMESTDETIKRIRQDLIDARAQLHALDPERQPMGLELRIARALRECERGLELGSDQ
jgi:hypothetical protein